MSVSPVTAPLLLVMLAGGTNVVRDALRLYPALMLAVAVVGAVLVCWPPKTVRRDKHTPD